MNEKETTLLKNFKTLLQTAVDPVTITDKLFQCGFLSDNQKKRLFDISRRHQNREDVWESLFLILPVSCSLPQFLYILLQVGYTDISLQIGQRLCMSLFQASQIRRFHRTPTGDSSQRFAQKLFMNFKINTHNNAFVNPREYCHRESQKYRLQLDMYTGGDEEIRVGIADKLAACLLAEIDSHIMLYTQSSSLNTNRLLKEFKQLIPLTSNSNVSQLSYKSRIGITQALIGKEGAGELHLQEALGMSFFVGRCVEISNLLYIYVFNLLTIYENKPTKEFRNKIIHIAELGLQSIEDETEVIREFWFRLFTLRIIYCLLGLSYRGDPICGISVDSYSILRSKQLLAALDKQWDRMESRRKIMYYVVKARIAELERQCGCIDTVLHFLNLAIDIGNEGEYGETQFVKRYASSVKLLLKSETVALDQSDIENSSSTKLQNNHSCDYSIRINDGEGCLKDFCASIDHSYTFEIKECNVKWSESENTDPKVLNHKTLQNTNSDLYMNANDKSIDLKTPECTSTKQTTSNSNKFVKTLGVVKIYMDSIQEKDQLHVGKIDFKPLNINIVPDEIMDTNETIPKMSGNKNKEECDDTNPKHLISKNNHDTCVKTTSTGKNETFVKTVA